MCQGVQKGGGGWQQGVISERLLPLCFIRVERGGTVQWPGAKATFL